MDERIVGWLLLLILAAFLTITIAVPSPEEQTAETLENVATTLEKEGLYDEKFNTPLRVSTLSIRIASTVATLLELLLPILWIVLFIMEKLAG